MSSLGRSGLSVPRMGVGAMTWGEATGTGRWGPAKLAYGGAHGPEEEAGAVEVSLAAGVNLFDTAAMYSAGASERRLGELTDGKDVVIATKFPPRPFDRAETLPEAIEGSIERLRRPVVDLLQVHYPSKRWPTTTLMELMADAVEAGKIRAVGVSNFSAGQMREAHAALADRGVPLASNQVEYSLFYRLPETDGLLDACRELGITLIAYSPLAAGALTGKYLSARPTGLRRLQARYRRKSVEAMVPVVRLLEEIGQGHGKKPGQVALRWLIENESVLPIPGAKNARQAADNLEALNFSLDPSEVEALDLATRSYRDIRSRRRG